MPNKALIGPTVERHHRATHPMTEAEARGVLLQMEAQVPSAAKRIYQARFFASNLAGGLSPEAVALYKLYASELDK